MSKKLFLFSSITFISTNSFGNPIAFRPFSIASAVVFPSETILFDIFILPPRPLIVYLIIIFL